MKQTPPQLLYRAAHAVTPRWRWLLVGMLAGGLCAVLLLAIFFAYGQPGLLLEQMNLRYCG